MKYHRKLEFFLGQGHEYAAFNSKIFDALYVKKDITAIIKPLAYFERTYDEYLFFYHHSGNYLEIVEHFDKLADKLPVKYYLLYYLATLLSDEYSPKDMGRYIAVHDDIVMQSLKFVVDAYQKTKQQYVTAEEVKARQEKMLNEYEWQYPRWDLEDFKANPDCYHWTLTTRLIQEHGKPVIEEPYFQLTTEGCISGRFAPSAYFHLLAYEIAIPKARNEPDLMTRVLQLKKVRSDFQAIHLDLTTQNDIGKKYADFFDVSAIVSAVNIYIENIESGMALAQATQRNSGNSSNEPLQFEKSYERSRGNDELLLSISKEGNKFWKGLPMHKVVAHFKVMTERKNRNGEYFLTPDQLVLFLKKGFLKDEKMPVQKINCANGEKGFVIKRFYELFDLAVGQYGHSNRKQPFIDLLTSCFDNWSASSITSYFKPGKTNEEW